MTLEERIRQLEERNAELEKSLADKECHIADLDRKIVSKDNRIAYLEQQLYGSRSEKRLPINPDALQLSLFSAEIDAQEQQRLDAAISKDEERREKLLKVDGYERKVRKPIDTSKLEVREEHIYPDGINPDEYNEVEPLSRNHSSTSVHDGQKGFWYSGSTPYSEDADAVFLPSAGFLNYRGEPVMRTQAGRYWCSDLSPSSAPSALYFTGYVSTVTGETIENSVFGGCTTVNACSVRCVQE